MLKGEVVSQQVRKCFISRSVYFQDSTLRRDCIQAQAEGGSKSRDLQRGEKYNQSLVTSILFRLISGDKTVHLFIYEAKNRNLESLCLALSEVDKRNICSLSPRGQRRMQGALQQPFPEHKGKGGWGFPNCCCFPESQGSGKIQHCQ